MLKRLPLIFGIIILLLVALAGWYLFIREVDPVANELATATPAPDSIVYGLDPTSSTLDFVMPDVPIAGDITGQFNLIGGSLVMQPTGDGTYDLVVNIVVDGGSVDTGAEFANQVMVKALEADKYPCGVFTGIGDTQFTEDEARQIVQLTLNGDLEISGTTQDNQDFITDFQTFEDGSATAQAQFGLSMADFGVDLGGEDLQATMNITAGLDIDPDTDQDLTICAVEVPTEDGDADASTDETTDTEEATDAEANAE